MDERKVVDTYTWVAQGILRQKLIQQIKDIYIYIFYRFPFPLASVCFGPHKLTFVLTRFKLPELPVYFGGNALTAPVLDFIRFAPQIFRAREKKRASIFFQFLFLAHSNSRFLFSALGRRICTKCMGLSAPLDLESAPHTSVPGRPIEAAVGLSPSMHWFIDGYVIIGK